MPTYETKKNPIMDWANNRSVFDPLHEQLIKRAVKGAADLFGNGMDPADAVNPLQTPVAPLVAAVKPHLIGELKKRGRALLDKVKAEGLERRALGGRPRNTGGRKYSELPKDKYGLPDWEQIPFYDNEPVPPEMLEALEFAQTKYPRIFGHLSDLADVDSLTQMQSQGGTLGSTRPFKDISKDYTPVVPERLRDLDPNPNKLINLGLSPKTFETAEKLAKISKKQVPSHHKIPQTIGHELLHAADMIVNPHTMEEYGFANKLPGGYGHNAREIRAIQQGEVFADKMKRGKDAPRNWNEKFKELNPPTQLVEPPPIPQPKPESGKLNVEALYEAFKELMGF